MNRSLLEGSPVCNKIIDLDCKLRYMSAAGLRQLKIPDIKPYYGQTYPPDFYPESMRAPLVKGLKLAMAGKISSVEAPVHDMEGNEVWYHTTFVPALDDDGRVKYVIGSSVDITERRRAEEELVERTRVNQMLLDSLPCVAMLLRPTTREIVASNKAAVEAGAVPGATCYGTWGQRDEACPWCLAPEVWATGQSRRMEVEAGGIVWDAHWYPVAGDLYLHYAFDITHQKQAEQERLSLERQVQHAQKLESLGVLAGGIAHDFNNLLAVMVGNADMALRDLSELSPARPSVAEIKKAGMRAPRLTNQMLAYSGKGQFVVKPMDLNALIQEMGHLLEVSISKKISLRYDLADELPAINADVAQMQQVVMNLITNASEAIGDDRGAIAVRTGVTQADRASLAETYLAEDLPGGSYVYLEVSDTGHGMDEDTQSKLFEPFFTTKFAGRGLGMAAVLGIVRGHKGAIRIESQLGKGTTFRLLFPCSEEAAEPEDAPEPGSAGDGGPDGGTVLVVDDEEGVRDLAKRMLESAGLTVLIAGDGQDAVEVLREHMDEIAVVLLDMTMPEMSGEEAFEELRRLRPDLPVLLCSGYAEEDATSHFAGKGLAGFIHKPFELDQMIAKVRGALRG